MRSLLLPPLSLSPVHVARRLRRRYFARPMGHPIGRNTALVSVFDERGPDGARDNDDDEEAPPGVGGEEPKEQQRDRCPGK